MRRFLHISDLHYRNNYSENGFEALIAAKQKPWVNVADCLNKELQKGLDFVLITGDLTHEGTAEDYQELSLLLKHLLNAVPVIPVPGNHDPKEMFQQGLFGCAEPAPLDTSYTLDGLRIVVLDSGRSVNGEISKEQIQWLKTLLAEPATEGTLLALHHPLIAEQEGLPCAAYDSELEQVIRESDIIGIFCGHTHRQFFSQFAGKPYFTADSMAFSMRQEQDLMHFENYAAYTVMQLQNRILSAQVRPVVPEILDITSFSSDKLSQLFS